MNDEAAFLQAMQTNPADNTLRLVFADWLEEQGDPTGMGTMHPARLLILKDHRRGKAVCCGAARSSIERRTCVLPTVSGVGRRSVTTMSAFVRRGFSPLDLIMTFLPTIDNP
jgi:uncharacterized protein (TIGR02996 family)